MQKDNDIQQDNKIFAMYDHLFSLSTGVFVTQSQRPAAGIVEVEPDACSVRDVSFKEITASHSFTDRAGKTHKNAITLTITSPGTLSILHESILLAIVSSAKQSEVGLKFQDIEMEYIKHKSDRIADSLFSDACKRGQSESELLSAKAIRTIRVHKSVIGELAGTSTDSRGTDRIKSAINELSKVHCHYKNKVTKKEGGQHLLAYNFDSRSGWFDISLNWRLTGALTSEYSYAYIDLDDRNKLDLDVSKVLHRFLSAHIFKSNKFDYKVETLMNVIWPGDRKKPQIARLKTKLLSEVLPDFHKIGWSLTHADGKITVVRPLTKISKNQSRARFND